MKRFRWTGASALALLLGCGGGDTMLPSTPPVPPPPPPLAATVVIETRKIIKDFKTSVKLDLNEWVGADTVMIVAGNVSPVLRVTARAEDGTPIAAAEPVVKFSVGTDAVTYRTLLGDSRAQIWLQREGPRYWTIYDEGTPAETQILKVTARLGAGVDSLLVVLPTALDLATDPRTLPEGVTLDDVGERVSTPLDWFTSRAGADDISYEFHVGEHESYDVFDTPVDSGPPILEVVQNVNGELEITAIGRGRRYLHYRARSSALEVSTGRILVAVDHCYPPELERRRLYDRASAGFRVELAVPEAWSQCAKVLIDHAVGFFEAALKDNTEPMVFPVVVFDQSDHCGYACATPMGRLVERREGKGFYVSGGLIAWGGDRRFTTPFGRIADHVTYETMLHELAHVFGIGTYWQMGEHRIVNPPRGTGMEDSHFPGPNAVAAFNEAGGSGYTGGKVPVSNDFEDRGTHWRSVLCAEIMTKGFCGKVNYLSAITLGALADFGWVVDMSVAEDYALPSLDVAGSVQADTVGGYDE